MRISIVGYRSDGECEISGRQGECVVIDADDGVSNAVVRFSELVKLIRFRARQEEKRGQEKPAVPRP